MPLINFKKQFATAVAMGSKCQTIRKTRVTPIKKGDTLHLYSGLRTKEREKLLVAKCKSVQDIEIGFRETVQFEKSDGKVRTIQNGSIKVTIDSKILSKDQLEGLAKADGFKDIYEFADFFKDRAENTGKADDLSKLKGDVKEVLLIDRVFKGQLIKW